MTRTRSADILQVLADHDVEFIVIGMTAGVLQGAPTTTLDLEIVHRRDPENVARLLQALETLDARYRHDSRGLRPGPSHLASEGHQLLVTRLGDLDCLGTIDEGRGYEELLPGAVSMRLGGDRQFRVLGLPALIEAKERSGRPKDVAVLPLLRATLDELRKRR